MHIAEVSRKYDISADTLRYYERIGLLPRIPRTKSGVRDYSEANCARIEFLICMRRANVSIEALQKYMRLLDEGAGTVDERLQILIEQRDLLMRRVDEMQQGLDLLNHKIENYPQMVEREGRMR